MSQTKTRKQQEISDLSAQLGMVPPQAIDAEEAVLGAILLEKDAIDIAIGIIGYKDFYKDAHGIIFQMAESMYTLHEPIDLITITKHLRSNGKLEIVGGHYYVTELTTKINSSANIEHHCRIIKEQALRRELIRTAAEVQRKAYDETEDVFTTIDGMDGLLTDINRTLYKNEAQPYSYYHNKAFQQIEENKKKGSEITGVPSGYYVIDQKTGGWKPGHLIVIAARPGMGKTSFVLCMAKNMAHDFKIPVAFFSLEMPGEELAQKAIGLESNINIARLSNGQIEDGDIEKMVEKAGKIIGMPVYIDDTGGLSITEFKAKARRLVNKNGVKVIIIDYMQLMRGNKNQRYRSREEEISDISRTLKEIAKELKVPIIALSQLSREVEKRGDKMPQLSDLRESGSIEQDADLVAFLFRPEYYGITTDGKGESLVDRGYVIVAKHRGGPLGKEKLKFIKYLTLWKDLPADAPERKKLEAEKAKAQIEPPKESNEKEDLPF